MTMLHKILTIVTAVGCLLMMGTAGAMELETISLAQGLVQMGIGFVMFGVGFVGMLEVEDYVD